MPFAQNIIIAGLLVLCAHIGGATAWVFSTIRLQQEVPDHIRGRIFSLEQGAFVFMYVLMNILYGFVFDK